ncbi:MAG: bacteriocin fulvocin C-related protein [Phascolarctobacterium sp.]
MLVMSFLLSSCNQEQIYSCDKSIDEWVHSHLSEVQTLSRSEWKQLTENFKVPVYRAFTLEQRATFWNEKLTEALTLGWSNIEKEHIQSLITFINEHQKYLNGYDSISDEDKNIFDIFIYQWIDFAKTNLGWSNKLIFAMLASGDSLLDTNGTLAINRMNNKSTFSNETNSTCNCSLKSDWCTPNGWDCQIDKTCEDTTLGCGTLFMYDCTGRCGGL